MQIFNQTLQQANKGSKRPIEDLLPDQELLSNEEKKHKRFKRSDDDQLSEPKFIQESNYWKVEVPRNSNCLFLSAILAYLIPVKSSDADFKDRFEKLFGPEQLDKLQEVKDLVQSYNPFLNAGDTYETLRTLTQKFRDKVIGFTSSNRGRFKNHIDDSYLSNMRKPDTWGSEIEIEAIDMILGRAHKFSSDSRDVDSSDVRIGLFHDVTVAGNSKHGNYYTFVLEKNVGDKYDVDRRLEKFVEDFVFIYESYFSEYYERLIKQIPKDTKRYQKIPKDFKFSTTKGLFEKVGLKDGSNYYKKLSNFHSLTNLLQKVKGDEYGFRLLFQWEKVNDGYTKLEETPSNEYKYLLMDLTDAEFKKKQDKILQKVNNKDPGELEERLKIILQQIRQDAEQNAKELSKYIKF